MKCLILICFLAVCSANTERPSVDRRIEFQSNGSVSLHGVNGNQFIISHYPQQNYYDIVINGIEIKQKHLHIDSENCQITHLEGFIPVYQQYKEKTVEQTKNHLFELLKKYEGKVDEKGYKDLLEKIEKAVENGKICHLIYHLLTKLDRVIEDDLIEKYVKHYHYQPEERREIAQATIERQQKLINLLLQYILTNKQEVYRKYQPYPHQYQPSSYQYPEYSHQYPKQDQEYPYQYQQSYPQQYPYQYEQDYSQSEQYPYGSRYYGGDKSTYHNAVQTIKPTQKGYGYGYGYNQKQYDVTN